MRRKKLGHANVQYLRYDHFFVLLAQHGEHPFFAGEASQVRDIRKQPLFFMGYSIACRRASGDGTWHASVRVQNRVLRQLKVEFERMAVHRSVEQLCRDMQSLGFEPYAPVRDQLRGIVRAMNRRRKMAGLDLVPAGAVRLRRLQVKPFETTQIPGLEKEGPGSSRFPWNAGL